MPKRKRKEKPVVMWANRVNLAGLYSDKPVRVTRDTFFSEAYYYDDAGQFSVYGAGTRVEEGNCTFASPSKEIAEAWTAGAKAVMRRLKEWATGD
jgi:hypothetical protein